MANKTYKLDYEKNGAPFGLDVTKEMVPKNRVIKFFDRIFSNVALGDEQVKLTLELYSPVLDKYKADHTVKLDVEKKSGNVADTGSNRDGIYHAAKIVGNFYDGLLRTEASKVFKRDQEERNRQMFIVEDLIHEVLETETGIPAKCYCRY